MVDGVNGTCSSQWKRQFFGIGIGSVGSVAISCLLLWFTAQTFCEPCGAHKSCRSTYVYVSYMYVYTEGEKGETLKTLIKTLWVTIIATLLSIFRFGPNGYFIREWLGPEGLLLFSISSIWCVRSSNNDFRICFLPFGWFLVDHLRHTPTSSFFMLD